MIVAAGGAFSFIIEGLMLLDGKSEVFSVITIF